MNHFQMGALACALTVVSGAFASSGAQEIEPGFEVLASSASGILAGHITDPYSWGTEGAFSKMGQIFHFSASDAGWTNVQDINGSGTMVGEAVWNDARVGFIRKPNGQVVRYLYPGAEQTVINAIDDRGRMLGWHYSGENGHGAILVEPNGSASPFDVPGYEWASWYELNNRGQIMGSNLDFEEFEITGLVYWMGQVATVDYPGARHTIPIDINNRGDVLAEAIMPYDEELGDSQSISIVWSSDGNMRPVEFNPEWAPTIVAEGDELSFVASLGNRAVAIDDSGSVIVVARGLYMLYGPYGPIWGTVKERMFQVKP
jgi:uncharacterized membrane protein